MTLKNIHLGKVLNILLSEPKKRKSILRTDIRSSIYKERGIEDSGGDFYSPFWADAKQHVYGTSDLSSQTEIRIESNKRRKRLYPLLARGFLLWWNEKRRWRNVPFEKTEKKIVSKIYISEIDVTIKLENILSIVTEEGYHRFIYPYFSESPALSPDTARIGLWLLAQGFPDQSADDFRVLDVIRGASFGSVDFPPTQNEREEFLRGYSAILREWEALRTEYD